VPGDIQVPKGIEAVEKQDAGMRPPSFALKAAEKLHFVRLQILLS
jgi:hypothetical protein